MHHDLIAVLAFLTTASVSFAQSSEILVSTQNQIRRYTAAGALISQIPVPYPGGSRPATEAARDLVVHPSGDVYVFNGTFHPYLSVRRAANSQWEHFQDPLWSLGNNGSHGGITLFDGAVFLAGSETAFATGALFRFDIASTTFTRFATQFVDGFIDLTVGWDGKLYALSAYDLVQVFDAVTLQHLSTITLPFALGARGVGVAADGTLLIASWQQGLKRFDANGNLQQTITTGSRHHDLDVGACGDIQCGDWNGRIIQTTAALTGYTQFFSGNTNTFVAWATPTVPAPAIATARAGTPSNPPAFTGGGAILGTQWSGTLQPFLAGAIADVVVFGAGAANVPTNYGTVLFDEALTWFTFDAAAGTSISVAIPNDCHLTGVRFVAQAASVSLAAIALTNALDVRISSF